MGSSPLRETLSMSLKFSLDWTGAPLRQFQDSAAHKLEFHRRGWWCRVDKCTSKIYLPEDNLLANRRFSSRAICV